MVMDEMGNQMDLFNFLLLSDHTSTLAEYDSQILMTPRHGQTHPQTYKFQDKQEQQELTLATEDDDDF